MYTQKDTFAQKDAFTQKYVLKRYLFEFARPVSGIIQGQFPGKL